VRSGPKVGWILPLTIDLDLLSGQFENLSFLGFLLKKGESKAESCTAMAIYTREREEHWLRDKQEEGRIVILEDESVWEVHPSDRDATARWLRMSTITVKGSQKEGSPYLLTNTTEGETARASYLGASLPGKTVTSEVA